MALEKDLILLYKEFKKSIFKTIFLPIVIFFQGLPGLAKASILRHHHLGGDGGREHQRAGGRKGLLQPLWKAGHQRDAPSGGVEAVPGPGAAV